MSTQCLERNKKSVKAYCTVLRVAGWVLLVGGVLTAIWHVIAMPRIPRYMLYLFLPEYVDSYLYPPILALVLAQLITYIFDREYQPGWLLRTAERIIYLYAVLVLLQTVLRYIYFITGFTTPQNEWLICSVLTLLLLAKLTILIGLGRLLRLVMPMIEESRTLV